MNYMTLPIILLSVLFIIIYIVKLHRTYKETFINRYEFLTKDDGFKILSEPNYFKYFNNYDYKLRNCNRDNVINVYRNNIKSFDTYEKKALIWILDILIPKIKSCIPNFPYDKWRFIKVNNLESNLPHTRDDCIVLPQWFIANLVKHKKYNRINTAIKDVGLTLIHEQTHVYQKLNKSIFNNLYRYYWKFKNPHHINNANILNNNRTNPDGLDINWIYKTTDNRHLLPVAIYQNKAKDS